MVRQHSSKPLAKEKRMSLNQTQRSFHIIHCDYKFVQPEFKDWKIVPELSLPVPRIFQWAGKNAKAVELNSIASRVMDEFSISTDDLIVLMNPLDCKEFWIDDYHYTEEGRMLQAHQVAAVIRAAMGTQPRVRQRKSLRGRRPLRLMAKSGETSS